MLRIVGALSAAQGFAAVAGAGALLIFAGGMDAAAFGRANILLAIAMLGSAALTLNIEAGAPRAFGPERATSGAAFRRFTRQVWMTLSGVWGLLCLGLASLDVLGGMEAGILAFLAPGLALLRLGGREGTALGAPMAGVLPRVLARPVALLCAAWLLLLVRIDVSPQMLPGAVLLGVVIALPVQSRGLAQVRGRLGKLCPGFHRKTWAAMGITLLPGLVFLEYLRPVVLLSASVVLSSAALGHLALALSIGLLASLPVVAVDIAFAAATGAAFGPRATTKMRANLLAAAARARIGAAVLGLALLPGAVAIGPELIAMWPEEMPALVLVISGIALSRGIFGNPVQVLALAGEERRVARIAGLGLLGLFGATAAGAICAGALGAALGAVVAHAVSWGLMWREVQLRLGLNCGAVPEVFLAPRGRRREQELP